AFCVVTSVASGTIEIGFPSDIAFRILLNNLSARKGTTILSLVSSISISAFSVFKRSITVASESYDSIATFCSAFEGLLILSMVSISAIRSNYTTKINEIFEINEKKDKGDRNQPNILPWASTLPG